MKDKILVTGIGLVSSLGDSLESFWSGLMKPVNLPREIEYLKESKGETASGFAVECISAADSSFDRIYEMGKQAILAVLKDWGGSISEQKRVCLVVGSGLGHSDSVLYHSSSGYYADSFVKLGDRLAGVISDKCENIYIANACSAGAQAISYGMDLLEFDEFDFVIAGGIDILSNIAYSGFLRLNAIDFTGCKPFSRDRKGIVVGEGAAFFLLEKHSKVFEKECKVYCEMCGAGITNDAFHVVQMNQDARQIVAAMGQALDEARLEKEDIDLIVAHGTGTMLNDRIEAKAINDFFEDSLASFYVTSNKGAIGHTGGASGAFGLLTAIGSMNYKCIPPICNCHNYDPQICIPLVLNNKIKTDVSCVMINTFAFGGTNVIVICKKFIGSDYRL